MRIKGVVFWMLLSPACWTLCTLNTSFYWHIFLTGTPPQCLLQSLLVVSRPERGGREQRDMPARELIPMTTETREAGGSGRLFCHVLMKAEWSRLDLHPSVAEQADSLKPSVTSTLAESWSKEERWPSMPSCHPIVLSGDNFTLNPETQKGQVLVSLFFMIHFPSSPTLSVHPNLRACVVSIVDPTTLFRSK